jgi:hypothetical protein
MLVIVSLRLLDSDRTWSSEAQHDANPTQNHPSEKEARVVLSDFGISEAGTNGYRRTVKIPTDGCSTEPIAIERISIVSTNGAAPSGKRRPNCSNIHPLEQSDSNSRSSRAAIE